MPKAYIAEYSKMMKLPEGTFPPIADESSLLAEQVVDFSGGVTPSSNFNPNTNYIRVAVDSICSIKIGLTAVATTSMKRLSAGDREYFALGQGAGAGWRFSAISNS